eukprot:Phypoly_transcript_20754.p1 GENE.Phypoly_transcript_20754~~Phypoly_transcript_20754.p1  ORF type:complete len:131 (+),score=18.84 Phypoly_transcript_20754:221-613(+)
MVVAGSRGAKLIVRMLHENKWKGNTLIISGMMPSGIGTFPAGVPILLLHGINDITVPIQSVRICASTGWVKLVELDDDHSLKQLLLEDQLKRYVDDLFLFSSAPPPAAQNETLKSMANSRSALLAAIKKK